MTEILDKITPLINTYEGGEWQSADSLREMLRELSSQYYYLTKYNIEAFQRYNGIRFLHDGSVASGTIIAEKQCPELRITRKILEATKHVLIAMGSELSIIKSER